MAENKKSFLLYCDLIHTVEKLSDTDAGLLLKHVLRYVNDKNPETDNLLIEIAFEPIKQALKRDLRKWENKLEQKSDAGIVSAFNKFKTKIELKENIDLIFIDSEIEKLRSKEIIDGDTRYVDLCLEYLNIVKRNTTKPTTVESVKHSSTKSTVSVSDSVIVSDSVKVIKDINTRKREFYNSLIPFLDFYDKELIKEFYDYWSEHGENDRKFRKEKEKSFNTELRLKTWFKRTKQFKEKNVSPKKEKVNAGLIIQQIKNGTYNT